MKTKDRVTKEQLGDAIVSFISSTLGSLFLPFSVSSASIEVPDEIEVDFSDTPLATPILFPKVSRVREITRNEVFVLSREEMFNAITRELDYFRARQYKGNRVLSTSIDFPERVAFKLRYVPMGSKRGEFLHRFDGKLKRF